MKIVKKGSSIQKNILKVHPKALYNTRNSRSKADLNFKDPLNYQLDYLMMEATFENLF